ncbi:O-phosphoseryl-tRNA(Sec) selenium transferase [Intoshia linei]|uniref:O-phosphoseryl-tRNA(Sec) selenium transferase n=1 Tax=Intoshia linei TaxID=1819745 RepID=A0A177B2Q9_9BILA|nr:O-phosphoseryl-tRNA(Sec) selenium transferase [Intoshia linei]
MDNDILNSLSQYLPSAYKNRFVDQNQKIKKDLKILLETVLNILYNYVNYFKGKIPEKGWSKIQINYFLYLLSLFECNNIDGPGLGEREGRVYSSLIENVSYGFAHGMGRSGDLTAIQPKALGSSVLSKLCNKLILNLIRLSGIKSCKTCFVCPMATGMSMMLVLLSFKKMKTHAKYCIWSRIDQKSCFKCIVNAGLIPIIIENELVDDELRTNIPQIKHEIENLGKDNILCIISTTSCFSPRAHDRIDTIAKICQEYELFHMVNNAYGLQSSKCCHLIETGNRTGRIDVFVQSCDKNLMIPVGGSIIAGFSKKLVNEISSAYVGRASNTPSIHLCITLLEMGVQKYLELLKNRKQMYTYLHQAIQNVAQDFGEKLLEIPHNSISMAMTITTKNTSKNVTELGGYLYNCNVTGVRVIDKKSTKKIENTFFLGYGSHCNNYPYSYVTVAAAIGQTTQEIDSFIKKFRKSYFKWTTSAKTDCRILENNQDSD